jgi:hypothetical protein
VGNEDRKMKHDLSIHEKQMRFMTALFMTLVLAFFAGLLYLINR